MKEKRKHQQVSKIWYPLLWQDWSLQPKQPNAKDIKYMLLIGCCGIVFCILVIFLSIVNYSSPLVREGIATEGVIVNIEQIGKKGSCNHYRATYIFDVFDNDGKRSYQDVDEISDCSVAIQLNETVKITYVASDPSKSMIGYPINKITDAPYVLGGFGIFLLVSVYLLFGGIYFAFHGDLSEEKMKNDI